MLIIHIARHHGKSLFTFGIFLTYKAFLQFKIYILVGGDTFVIVIGMGNLIISGLTSFHVMYCYLETSSDMTCICFFSMLRILHQM